MATKGYSAQKESDWKKSKPQQRTNANSKPPRKEAAAVGRQQDGSLKGTEGRASE